MLNKVKMADTNTQLKATRNHHTGKLLAIVIGFLLLGFWLIENERQKALYHAVADVQRLQLSKLAIAYQPQLLDGKIPRQQAFEDIANLIGATDIFLFDRDSQVRHLWENNLPETRTPWELFNTDDRSSIFNHHDGKYVVVAASVKDQYQLFVSLPNSIFDDNVSFKNAITLLLVCLPWLAIFAYRHFQTAQSFKRLNDQLCALERRMNSTQKMSKVGSWDYDIASETLIWSREVFDIFGLEFDASNTGSAKFFDAIHPDDLQMVSEVFEQSLQSDSGQYDVEHRIIDYKTGKVRYLHERCFHIADENGHFIKSVGMVQDITERHLAKQAAVEQGKELDLVLDIVANGIITIDETGIVLSFNARAEKLFGYRASQIIGQKINRLMPQQYADYHDGFLRHYLDTGEKKIIDIGREVDGMRSDGKIFPLQLTVAELPTKPNQLRRFIGSCMDLTEIKQREEMLWRSQKLDALGKISGGVAHDFNNLLGVILGYAQLLNNQLKDNAKLSRYAEQIVYASERGAALTGKLLAFSRRRPTVHHHVNINQLIQEQTEVISRAITANVDLVLNLNPQIWTTKLEESAFDDMLLNLAINAMHAIDGQGQLTIATSNVSLSKIEGAELDLSAGDYICLSVSDDGCGMNEQVMAQIFDPFFTTKGKDGSGFGLSQVYGFVRSAGGVINVESREDEGSCFSLYFPRQLIRIGEALVDDSKAQLFISGNESVLVVDDEPSMCNLARDILTKYGYRVHTETSAEQALSYLQGHSVDILLSDIIMPKMNGYQLVAKVRALYPQIRCLLVSGFMGEQEQTDENQCADVIVLTKPYTTYSLMRAIRIELNKIVISQSSLIQVNPWQNNATLAQQYDLLLDKALALIELLKSSENVGKQELVTQIVDFGQRFTKLFQFEEAQMAKWGYPYLNEHIKAHRHFIAQLDLNIDDMKNEQIATMLEQFVTAWVVEHVLLMDKAVVPFYEG